MSAKRTRWLRSAASESIRPYCTGALRRLMDDFEALFAKIAVDRGFLTSSQTAECIREFDAQQGKSLGENFVEKGHITPLQLREVLQGRREVMLAEDSSQLAQARRLVDQLRAAEAEAPPAPPTQPQPHPPAQPEADTSGSVPGPAVSRARGCRSPGLPRSRRRGPRTKPT